MIYTKVRKDVRVVVVLGWCWLVAHQLNPRLGCRGWRGKALTGSRASVGAHGAVQVLDRKVLTVHTSTYLRMEARDKSIRNPAKK